MIKDIFNIRITFLMLMVFTVLSGWSQLPDKKEVSAVRITNPPKIDGDLSDDAWKSAPVATDFLQMYPFNGRPATHNSEVKIIYDNNAIYIGAMLTDPHPDSIYTELSERDKIGMTDYFGVYIDCYNDYLTAYGFIVTASGVQCDVKSTETGGEDFSWDAVWESEIKIVDDGWVVELKIPYSALRFPKKEKQLWGFQIFRQIMRYRQNTTWNLVDREVDGLNNQAGELHSIENIDPPLRLSFVPYVSGYLEKSSESESWGYSYNLGMDLKYGINESFTLDMTLVPDFGQVQSDDEIYNLSPFEVYYSEKRPFFMEGTELFDKGDIFYTRRIGTTPSGYDDVEDQLKEHEKISNNPQESQLINATKLSGKTKKKLGIGVFNAITTNTFAQIEDTLSGSTRRVLTEPFTNYNMFVLDQALKNNSYVSFYNTNVYKHDIKYSANVTGTDFKLANKANRYAIFGRGIVSQKYDAKLNPEFGYTYNLSAGKISGQFTWEFEHEVIDDKYDPKDMGFLRRNNKIEDSFEISYNIFEPNWIFLDWFNELWVSYEQLYHPNTFTNFDIGGFSRIQFKNHLTSWLNMHSSPVSSYDYYEPRVEGRYFRKPPAYNFNLGLSPDYRKAFVVDFRFGIWHSDEYNQTIYYGNISPRLRINDKLMFILRFGYDTDINSIGYVTDTLGSDQNSDIIFGKRDIQTWENVFDANYRFNNKSSLALRARHYWITVNYSEFYDLLEDGNLEHSDYHYNNDFGFNLFNIDMIYIWNFAPGSEINIVWKNAINTYEEPEMVNSIVQDIETDYFNNLNNILNAPAVNSFSIKLLYYLDYQYLRKKSPTGI